MDLNGTLRLSAAEARRRWPDLVPVALTGDLPALRAEDLDEALGRWHLARRRTSRTPTASAPRSTPRRTTRSTRGSAPAPRWPTTPPGRGRSWPLCRGCAATSTTSTTSTTRWPWASAPGQQNGPPPSGRRPVLGAGSALLRGLLRRRFFAAFLAGAFLAGAFLAGALFAAFLAGAFFAGLLGRGLLGRGPLRGLLGRAFFAGAFFAAFLAGAFFAGPSSQEPSWPAPSWPGLLGRRLLGSRLLRGPSWPAPSSRPSWQSSWSSSSSPGRQQRPPERLELRPRA